MKRIAGIIIKVFAGLLLLVLVLMFTLPVIFKDKIKAKVEEVINQSVNAHVTFSDYKLGFFRDFPNLTFSLEKVSVTGIGKFENDTLTSFSSLNLVFNLSSLFKKSGYEIKSLIIKDGVVNAIVLEDGSANWDIAKETAETPAEEEAASGMKILLNRVEILNSSISYTDISSDMQVLLGNMDFDIKGDMTGSITDLAIMAKAEELTFIMEGMKYLNRAAANADINVTANLDSMIFKLRDNHLAINDLALSFAGTVAMPDDDITTNLTFYTEQTSFKALLSMIPAVYMKDFQELRTSGEFTLNGSAIGVYSDADSSLPDISLNLSVNNGLISYPDLPEQIKDINVKSDVFINGKDMDKSTVNVERFHMELAGNPFDMSIAVKNPVSDPDVNGQMTGKIDLSALSKAVPLDSISLSGVINMSLTMAGRMSAIEKEQYDNFKASGSMDISGMMVSIAGYPEVNINNAGFVFTPAFAELKSADLKVGGKSDFMLNGKLENYIPYVFKNDVVRGNLVLHSKLVDLTDIMSGMTIDTAELDDTTSLAVIRIPENIDFDFNALIDNFIYDKIKASNLKGHIIVKEGILSMKETGMNILGGSVRMDAVYDPRDTLRPSVKINAGIESLGINDAFNSFNTVQKLAPTASGLNGKVNIDLTYSSLLGSNLMPVIRTITGGGRLRSNEVTLVKSTVYNKMKEVLKLGENYTNTFKDLNISFKINDGRIIVSPFDAKVGNIKMNIGGDQGIDQTINYIVKTEIPRSDLGSSVNSLIDNLSAQASRFGITYKPAEMIKVNVKVTGTFLKPVLTPFFGSAPADSTGIKAASIKETAKQAIDNKIDQATEKVRSEAEIQADKIIKEAEEKGETIRSEAAKAAEKIRQEADQQSQKLIKEAESKGTIAKMAARKAADTIVKEADKKADQLILEADNQADKLLDEAKAKKTELLK